MSDIEPDPGFRPDTSLALGERADPAPFFLVGTRKLVVLTIVTLGSYEIYWFYQHWRQVRRLGGEDVWPVARTLFTGFFSYALFKRMNEEADARGVPSVFSPLLLAIGYFVSVSCARFDAPLWLVVGTSIVPLALAQSIVNGLPQVQALPRPDRNERLSKTNWAGIGVFALLGLLMMLPDPEPSSGHVSIPTLAEDMNRDLPRTMSGGVTLERVEWAMDGVGLYVRITQLSDTELPKTDVVERVRRTLLEMACASSGLEGIALDRRIPLRYTIGDKGGARVALMELTSRAQCGVAEP